MAQHTHLLACVRNCDADLRQQGGDIDTVVDEDVKEAERHEGEGDGSCKIG